ncbi:fimbrial protein [Enterobacillus tribolii]|uniref:Type 1 fimbria pilin n=1 Tax=Enterobacillus tribolii TaxID=1487935 RepID=A0A370QNX5_9GAMM|nr:fimbrial protein [Enterobacillus tribolii]MBW7981906.1 fimbrial protein [Enterobacillus tribolii]RDK90073.1 type 1 fimbria pilin [Enterobacillus tribolii]
MSRLNERINGLKAVGNIRRQLRVIFAALALLALSGVYHTTMAACTTPGRTEYNLLSGSIKISPSDPVGTVYVNRTLSLPTYVTCTGAYESDPNYFIARTNPSGYYAGNAVVSGDTVTAELYVGDGYRGLAKPTGIYVVAKLLPEYNAGICTQSSFGRSAPCPSARLDTIPPTSKDKKTYFTYTANVQVTVTKNVERNLGSISGGIGFDSNGSYSRQLIEFGMLSQGDVPGNYFFYAGAVLSLRDKAVFVTKGCRPNSNDINIPLGTIPLSQFKGVGTTVGEKTFSVGLNCDAGVQASVTLEGIADAQTSSNAIQLIGSGHADFASGVAVQILHNGSVIKPNGTTKIATIDSTTTGANSFNMSARYYQTAATVTEGKANAVATLTIWYN